MKRHDWKSHLGRRGTQGASPSSPAKARAPEPFEPLTHEESRALLLAALDWLERETWVMLAMPDGPAKEQLQSEFRGRERSMLREYERLVRERED